MNDAENWLQSISIDAQASDEEYIKAIMVLSDRIKLVPSFPPQVVQLLDKLKSRFEAISFDLENGRREFRRLAQMPTSNQVSATARFGMKPGELYGAWARGEKRNLDEIEWMIVDALGGGGIAAWPGDGVGMVSNIIRDMIKKHESLEAKYEELLLKFPKEMDTRLYGSLRRDADDAIAQRRKLEEEKEEIKNENIKILEENKKLKEEIDEKNKKHLKACESMKDVIKGIDEVGLDLLADGVGKIEDGWFVRMGKAIASLRKMGFQNTKDG